MDISDDVYLSSIKFKFSMNDYPCAILSNELSFLYANDAYCSIFGSNLNDGCDLGYCDAHENFRDIVLIVEAQSRNVLLQKRQSSYIDIFSVKGKTLVFYKRKNPLIAPSGKVLGVEVHLVSMAAVVGSMNVLSRHDWYSRNDSTVGDVTLKPNLAKLTLVQKTYLFFVLQGFSNNEIAECIGVSKSTVENTIRNITIKMAKHVQRTIPNRSELKKLAFQLGYGYVLPRTILKPHSIPLQCELDDWMY